MLSYEIYTLWNIYHCDIYINYIDELKSLHRAFNISLILYKIQICCHAVTMMTHPEIGTTTKQQVSCEIKGRVNPANTKQLYNIYTIWFNVEDNEPTLYKFYTNVLYLLGSWQPGNFVPPLCRSGFKGTNVSSTFTLEDSVWWGISVTER